MIISLAVSGGIVGCFFFLLLFSIKEMLEYYTAIRCQMSLCGQKNRSLTAVFIAELIIVVRNGSLHVLCPSTASLQFIIVTAVIFTASWL